MRPKGKQSRNKGESCSRAPSLCFPKPPINKRIREMADWSLLPSNLVDRVAGFLMVPDQAQMASVCKPWREAMADGLCCRRPAQGIWIIVCNGAMEALHYCVIEFAIAQWNNSTTGRRYFLPMPSKNECIVGSTRGWVILQNRLNCCLQAFHPISGTSIMFPKTDMCAKKAVLVTKRHGWLGANERPALAIIPYRGFSSTREWEKIFVCAGDKVWTELTVLANIYFADIVAHEGKLYALGNKNQIVIFDLDGREPSSSTVQIVNGSNDARTSDRYLITKHISVVCGELVIVRRWSGTGCKFEVSRLQKDNESQWKWVTTKDLAGHAIMYSYEGVITVSPGDHEGLKADCIYFINEGGGTISLTEINLKSETVTKISHSVQSISWLTPFWFLP